MTAVWGPTAFDFSGVQAGRGRPAAWLPEGTREGQG